MLYVIQLEITIVWGSYRSRPLLIFSEIVLNFNYYSEQGCFIHVQI